MLILGLEELVYPEAVGLCAGRSVDQLRLALGVLDIYQNLVVAKHLGQASSLDAVGYWQVFLILQIILLHCQVREELTAV